MIGFISWIIGVVLCVKAVLEIMKWPVDGVKKLLVAIIILLTSWIGICVYYFWGRENLPQILKYVPVSFTEVNRRVLRTRGIDNSYPLLFRNSVGLSPNCSL